MSWATVIMYRLIYLKISTNMCPRLAVFAVCHVGDHIILPSLLAYSFWHGCLRDLLTLTQRPF